MLKSTDVATTPERSNSFDSPENLTLNLYFAPLACSLATRIALYEAGVEAQYTYVDLKAKCLADGSDFFKIAPLGQVPVLRVSNSVLLTENAAILQYVADRFPEAALAPPTGLERSRLQQWLSFIGTELHKAVFIPLLDPKAPEGAKVYAREKAVRCLEFLQEQLSAHDFLLDRFTVSDAYLVTVLNWAKPCEVNLAQWPAVYSYHQRLLKRASIAKAVSEEWTLYQEEKARHVAN
jgi:glutathione S-transferase